MLEGQCDPYSTSDVAKTSKKHAASVNNRFFQAAFVNCIRFKKTSPSAHSDLTPLHLKEPFRRKPKKPSALGL